MKLKICFVLLACVGLMHTISFAQTGDNPNPYAIFGSDPYVAGSRTETEKVMVIGNFPKNSPVSRLEHDTASGMVTYFDRRGKLLGQVRLDAGERAWMSVDPLAHKFYSLSPYAYAGNNPIRYIDPNGMEFTDAAWEWIERLLREAASQQGRNSSKIAAKQAKLAAAGISDKKAGRLSNRIVKLEETNAKLEEVKTEVNLMSASDQVYDVRKSDSHNTKDNIVGTFEFDFSTGIAVINMPTGGGLGLFAHELKHAYQFETGDLSLIINNGLGGINLFYDKYDEVAAYERGSLFGQTAYGINNLPATYRSLPTGPIDVSNHPNIMHTLNFPTGLQAVANASNSAFRVNGITYTPR